MSNGRNIQQWWCGITTVEKAEELEVSIEDMIEARNSNNYDSCEPLERSSVDEVTEWVAASKARNKPVGGADVQPMSTNDGDESDETGNNSSGDDSEEECYQHTSDSERDIGLNSPSETESENEFFARTVPRR